jgi:hypothetical protein
LELCKKQTQDSQPTSPQLSRLPSVWISEEAPKIKAFNDKTQKYTHLVYVLSLFSFTSAVNNGASI